tara:strand:+ start:956 stop:1258 length:303 start_codon:yes stop_codon:yes gene_type:complete
MERGGHTPFVQRRTRVYGDSMMQFLRDVPPHGHFTEDYRNQILEEMASNVEDRAMMIRQNFGHEQVRAAERREAATRNAGSGATDVEDYSYLRPSSGGTE